MAAFELAEAVAVLARTPAALRAQLEGLPEAWLRADEGPGSWSPRDVVGHLIQGEQAAWLPRIRFLLEHGGTRAFVPFDRTPRSAEPLDGPLAALLDEFAALRSRSLRELAELKLTPADLVRVGAHPEFDRVTLGQLLAAWVVHDLGHLAQIDRALAGRYREDCGPWAAYLPILAARR